MCVSQREADICKSGEQRTSSPCLNPCPEIITSNNVAASLTQNQKHPVTFKINLYSSSDLEIQVQEMEYKNKRDMLLGVGMPCLSPRQVSIFTTRQKADSVHEEI